MKIWNLDTRSRLLTLYSKFDQFRIDERADSIPSKITGRLMYIACIVF